MGGVLYHLCGLSGSGPWYGFWSGFGSDIGELAVFAGLAGLIRKHQCHQRRCWRFGHYRQDNIGTLKCRKHLSKDT